MKSFEEYTHEIETRLNTQRVELLAKVRRRLEILSLLADAGIESKYATTDIEIAHISPVMFFVSKDDLVPIRKAIGALLEETYRCVDNADEGTVAIHLGLAGEPGVITFRYITELDPDSPCKIVREVSSYHTLVCERP